MGHVGDIRGPRVGGDPRTGPRSDAGPTPAPATAPASPFLDDGMETSTPTTSPGDRTRIGAPPMAPAPETPEPGHVALPGGEGPDAGASPPEGPESPEGPTQDGDAPPDAADAEARPGPDVSARSVRANVPRTPPGPMRPDKGGPTRGPRTEPGTGFELPRTPVPPERRKVKDGFRPLDPQRNTTASPYLGAGEARGPVLDLDSLVPGDLKDLEGQPAVARRFASDSALLSAQVRPASLPSSDRVARLWAFFAAYAEAATAHPPAPEAKAAFSQALKDQGFAGLQDAHTGRTGVEAGLWVLDAPSPAEARERAKDVQLEPPPDVRRSEQAAPMTPGLYQPIPAPFIRRDEQGQPLQNDDRDRNRSERKLGTRMLWNVLHRFRAGPEEEDAQSEGQWDRMVFGAVLALTGVALAVIALVTSL